MYTAVERLELLAAELHLEMTSPATVVARAADLVADMPSNEALARLAGAEPLLNVVVDLLTTALEQEGSTLPQGPSAGRLVARHLCRSIVENEIEPIDGARAIWWKVVRQVPELESDLGHFVGLASEWEDDAARRDEYATDIRMAAAEVCGR
jgi:hypothetical protein